jgi:branched-chain amino acid transport system ATP-binding protein
MALLEVEGVTRRFGGLSAVDDLSFVVREGEILGVIGPNGAGKTTLLNLITALLPITVGTIRLRGRIISGLACHAIAGMGVARTFQIVKPLKGLTVRENVAVGGMFGHRSGGLPIRLALAKADETLDFVGLAPRAHAPVTTLTVADLKRLELARALAMEPTLLLLDEVMAGLNPKEVEWAMGLIREVNRRGVTILVIEHVMKAIMGISHRILVLHHGRGIAQGSPGDVAADPRVIEAYLGRGYAERQQGRA